MIALAGDFGGTRIKLGVVRDDALVANETLPVQADISFSAQLALVGSALHRLCATFNIPPESAAGFGVSFPSIIEPNTARIADEYGKHRDAVGFDLRTWTRKTLGVALAIENDARTALLGEWRAGAGRGSDNLVMLTLGTGIGTAAVIEGRLLRGVHHQAGCLGGHSTLHYLGAVCTCGNIGCAETEASTAALPTLARSRSTFPQSSLAQEPVLDYAAVFRAARLGDHCALELRDQSLRVWSATAVNLIHAYDPERVIVGGGLMAAGHDILPFMRSYVQRHARTPWGEVHIAASALGDHAALLGCNELVKTRCR
jgi:glucokinase